MLDLWLNAAHEHFKKKDEVPIVLDVEMYTYFGSRVSIVEVNVYRGGVQCTIDDGIGHRVVVEREELDLAPIRK